MEQAAGGGLGLLEQAEIPRQVGKGQLGQPVLAAAEEVAGAPELQVLLGDPKAVGGGARESGLRVLVMMTQ